MLLTETATVRWEYKTKKWYESKGYVFTKWKEEFEINVEDLPIGSHVPVDIQCDECGEIKSIPWKSYKRSLKEDETYYCQKCASRLYGNENKRKSRLKNGVSFYEWCYRNLPKEVADIILSRWDYNLNIDGNGNILTPKDVSYGTRGFNKKGYWFKCLDHPEHESEQKSINHFTSGTKGSLNCHKCNSISITYPELIKLLVNKEDALKYSAGSDKKVLMKCPNCGYKKEIVVPRLLNQGFGCPCCSDGISYPEKFIFSLIGQLNINFKYQLTKTTFKWCNNYRYDFYIKNINCIVETHGIQHYEEVRDWDLLQKTQENDKQKEELAKNNCIYEYIVLDCRKSTIEWIKKGVMQSELPNLLNFKEEDIDWLKCHEYACNSLVKIVCDLWNTGIKIISEIADILKLNKVTIRKYLKQGAEIEWCDYDPIKASKDKKYLNKTVICLTTGKIFASIKDAKNKNNITNISSCCIGISKSAGKHPITGEKLVWAYYNSSIQSLPEKEVILV